MPQCSRARRDPWPAREDVRATAVLREAVTPGRGPALAGLVEERRFATAAAARLEDLRLTAIARLAP